RLQHAPRVAAGTTEVVLRQQDHTVRLATLEVRERGDVAQALALVHHDHACDDVGREQRACLRDRLGWTPEGRDDGRHPRGREVLVDTPGDVVDVSLDPVPRRLCGGDLVA